MYWLEKQWTKRNNYEQRVLGRELKFTFQEFINEYPDAERIMKLDRYGPATIDNFVGSFEEYDVLNASAMGWTCHRCRKWKPREHYQEKLSSMRGTGYTCKDCYDWSKRSWKKK